MSDALERRYRQMLRAYPSRWRSRHGEELVGVMLDVAAAEGRQKATRSELAHVVLHGAAARVNQYLPRRHRDRLAAVGCIGGASLALVMLVLGELGRWFRWNSYNLVDHPFGAFTTPAVIVFILTLTAFGAVAAHRRTTAKILHGAALAAAVGVGITLAVTEPSIKVHPLVFCFFAAANLLALLGNPVRTARLHVFIGAPALGVLITATSYLQGGGAQRTFWGGPYLINDQRLAFWFLELLVIAALLAAVGPRIRPWACLLLVPLTSLPLSGLFLCLGGSSSIGLIGIPPEFFYGLCSVAGLVSAWAAWKSPVISFSRNSTGTTTA
ncbi:hypothetical protein LJ754_04375 [Arthrobacter sp. zg-Y40]|uniref:hypothetical protein n=1 Tax=Arthrobacter sp. zg-Y40 TaxID=2886939 RepID=UPI001D133402|nr:hypothetical protein [Arthrobacter sp. zg-Y40]MCC3278393.1 hypothetical protein [Arthrobacter sp. zg-Y40]